MTEQSKGTFFALGASVLLASIVLISKTLLVSGSPWTFTTFFFTFGALCFIVYFVAKREWKAFQPAPGALRAGFMIGAIDAVYTLAYFSGVKILNPAVAAFFGHLSEAIGVLAGIIILRERFRGSDLIGLVIAAIGLITMTARMDGVVIHGFLFMLVAAVFFSMNALLIKKYTQKYPPMYLAFYRTCALSVIMSIVSATVLGWSWPRSDLWGLYALLGFLGPFLNYIFLFNALKRLEVARTSAIRMSYSLVVLVGAYFIYSKLPTTRQIAGGLILLAGVMLMVLGRHIGRRAPAPVPAPTVSK